MHNLVSREELIRRLDEETFVRRTLSLYRYFEIPDPQGYRDELWKRWSRLECLGRIYVAREGINAQMSVPEHVLGEFLEDLEKIPGLSGIPIKYAIEDNGKSFFKLTIKVREKIVADGFEHGTIDFSNVGSHLSALEFHELVTDPGSLVVDMRNEYEFEVGHFMGAHDPQAGTFREAIQNAVRDLEDQKDKKILLYCTGGIRCEKASAYFRHCGFKNVYQLHGGIIEYAHRVKEAGLKPHFTGKNFVFDERLGESVDGQVISSCHCCGGLSDIHRNCANVKCHKLFIQCPECCSGLEGCCSAECLEEMRS